MEKDKISIIIPVYQAEIYLEKCLNSVSQQSYHNLEVFLIDDGSTDNSGRICDNMAKLDKRFVVVHKRNQGVSMARNYGLSLCTGKYVMFVDADDWLEFNCCKSLYEKIQQSNSDICFCEMFIEKNQTIKSSALDKIQARQFFNIKRELLKATIPFQNEDSENNMVFYGPYCKMFKREIIESLSFFEGLKYGEDAIFNLQAIMFANSFCFLSEAFYHYRKNNVSVTSLFRLDRVEQSILRLKLTRDILDNFNLYFLNDLFVEMFINIQFSIINNLFIGKKVNFGVAWSKFRTIASDSEMRSIWSQIRNHYAPLKVFDIVFCGNKLMIFIVFLRFRYFK